jgi:hypothetical protein
MRNNRGMNGANIAEAVAFYSICALVAWLTVNMVLCQVFHLFIFIH